MTPLSTPAAQGTVDTRREEQLRIQALGAALSRREWWEVEQAYNRIRDEFDRRPVASPSPEALPASGVDVERIASSLASMLIEYVDGGINSNQNWRSGFNEIIQARLRRLLPSAALTSAPAPEDRDDG